MAGRAGATLVYLSAAGDTPAGIAERFLGSASRAWVVAQANATGPADAPVERWAINPGELLIVPLAPPSPLGVSPAGVQTVAVLCYHRFAPIDPNNPNKMVMSAPRFEAQLQWLARENVSVLRLSELLAFMQGQEALPARAVVLTIDDGYESFYRHAFPLIKKYRVPVTLFVYTDIIGTRDGLSWAQLREMAQSGLVDIQAHSKTHRNLTELLPGESDEAYRRALVNELRQPRQVLERQLADVGVKVQHFAYPYGDSNDRVLDALAGESYTLAFTVRAGGNAFYGAPHLLRRTMIFGDHTLDDFIARVQTRRPLNRP